MRIIPKPYESNIGSGTIELKSGFSVCLGEYGERLGRAVIKKMSPFAPVIVEEKDAFLRFVSDRSVAEEGYILNADEKGIEVRSSDEKGAFYGMITLCQLSRSGAFSYCRINDKPRFKHRGFMLDVARHFFGMDEIKQILDNMAYYKLNVFHWHLTEDQGWRIEIKKHPDLCVKGSVRQGDWLNVIGKRSKDEYGKGCFFTQEQVREIVAYATDNYITVIPEIDMPGHLTSALSVYPDLSCEKKPLAVSNKVGVKDTVGCIGNPDFWAFCRDVIDEVAELFPSPYFHIGGDEVPRTKWKECPRCHEFMREKGIRDESNLQGYFTAEMAKYLEGKGKTLIGWDEILDCDDLPESAVVQWWRGPKAAMERVKNGGKVILSRAMICYLDYPYIATTLEKVYNLTPEHMDIPDCAHKNVLGVEAPLWTEYVYDKKKLDFQIYPRLQALAEAAWTASENKNFADFESRLVGFFAEMDEQGINYCPREKYNPKGLRGVWQRLRVGRKWPSDPNCEVNL